jgi:ABC-2 type transport system permease protein
MRSIYALVMTDLSVLKRYLLILLGFFLLCPIFLNGVGAASGFVVGLVAFLFAAMAIATDEFGQVSRYIASLPVKRAFIPLARYVEVIVFAVIGGAFISALTLGFSAIPGLPKFMPPNAAKVPMAFLAFIAFFIAPLLLLSFFMPFWYRFGYAKTKIVYIIAVVALPIAASQGGQLARSPRFSDSIARYASLPFGTLFTVGVLATVLMLGISCLVSMRIYERKEF